MHLFFFLPSKTFCTTMSPADANLSDAMVITSLLTERNLCAKNLLLIGNSYFCKAWNSNQGLDCSRTTFLVLSERMMNRPGVINF